MRRGNRIAGTISLWSAAAMDEPAVLAAYDEQVRRRPQVTGPDEHVERAAGIVRVVSTGPGWAGVTWSDLDELTADPAIAAQVDRFGRTGRPWEWKLYSYDRPADLPERLAAAGLVRGPGESLLVAQTADLGLDPAPPPGVQLLPVVDAAGIDALVRVHDEVFGGDGSAVGAALAAQLGRRPARAAAMVAVAEGTPIAAGRVELPPETEFAGVWGGGTVPGWRRRGVFRALVAARAAVAAAAGFRYVHVDASPQSRPILLRLGFAELATTTPFVCAGGQGGEPC